MELQHGSGVVGWSIPVTKGIVPSPRESHTAVIYCKRDSGSPKMYVFGGMCGARLDDLWQLDLGELTLLCSCLENPRDGGAWWVAVYGVAQSQTRLKRLSSSSSCQVCVFQLCQDRHQRLSHLIFIFLQKGYYSVHITEE